MGVDAGSVPLGVWLRRRGGEREERERGAGLTAAVWRLVIFGWVRPRRKSNRSVSSEVFAPILSTPVMLEVWSG